MWPGARIAGATGARKARSRLIEAPRTVGQGRGADTGDRPALLADARREGAADRVKLAAHDAITDRKIDLVPW
jgi:hypothetical protein